MRKLLPVLLMFAPLPAYADGAPASVDADYSPVRIELNADSSPIDARPRKLEAKASGGEHSALGTTARVQAAASQKFMINYLWDGAGLGLNLGASAKADFAKAPGDQKLQLQNVDARALGVSPFTINVSDRPFGMQVVDYRTDYKSFSPVCYDPASGKANDICLKALPPAVEKSIQDEISACLARKDSSPACKAGFDARATAWLKRQHEEGHPRYLDATYSPHVRPSRTGSVKFLNAQLVYNDQKSTRTSAKGVLLDLMDVSGHLAFKINGLPIDLCAQGSVGLVMGKVETLGRSRESATEFAAQGCAGVQVGQVGRLGYDYRLAMRKVSPEADYRSDGPAWVVNQSHEVSLRKIAGTPVSVAASLETARAETPTLTSPKQAPVAGSALETSAKFISVGGEF